MLADRTPLHLADGRTKFIYFIWVSLLAYIFYDYILTLVFLVVNVTLAFIGRVARQVILPLILVVLPWMGFAIPILSLPLGFPWNQTVVYRLTIFGLELPVYLEGLAWGFTWPLRIGVTISAALLFYLTTQQTALIAMLFRFRVPFKFIYMVAATLQFIPLMADEVRSIYQAQLARGLRTDVNLVKKLSNFVRLLVPLTLSSLGKVQTRAIALESRGFSAPVAKTVMYDIRFKTVDYVFFGCMAAATVFLAYIYATKGYSPFVHLKYLIG
ncbi:cobalt/nickel ABC transporter permease [Candidatus Caldarchaeum subterraneum]|uniref:Cobalt/nickel ABC transporter permease n=1 Tax=Caldiarchaeum subterraneum TaxID=311458 RepID=E6N732_CALS0|nr:cobalt/nickel ABC transporter permease [Candidatus Caldarchaeum subterraneum]BAJ50884.1 cobalt/nickel ABC transporter permease [Candidatus Caldarchaeum subterraneum]GBC72336.1 Putative HMP/thiamine permease protein YkoC [archaeon HR03]